LKQKFENIIEYHDVSSVTGQGIKALKESILYNASRLPHVGDVLPKKWVVIRERFEKMNSNYISFSKYKEICSEYGLNDDQASSLSEYFHDLGVFLNFRESPILQNTIFLKPEWATNAVYKVVDNYNVIDAGGKFRFADLQSIWSDCPEFPTDKYVDLVELMKSFEICFELPNGHEYILPELLPANQPIFKWEYDDSTWFKYKYDFMPAGIMTRLIVNMHDLIKDNLYWKDGVVLEWENTQALISKTSNREISVWVNGEEKKSILGIIRRYMQNLNAPFMNLEVNEMVRCLCSECKNDSKPFFYPYKNLQKEKSRKVERLQCQKSFENMQIDLLLGELSHERNEGKTIKIFLASSAELKEERVQVELMIAKMNRRLRSMGLFLELVIWEELKHSFYGTRIQNYFNIEMLKCDVVIFMFYQLVGDFTVEEFNTAFNSFNTGSRPFYLYVYFKEITNVVIGQIDDQKFSKINNLKTTIQKAEQIYCKFTSNEDLKTQLQNQLTLIADDYYS